MREIHSGNFGLLIAYVMPGFIALLGVSRFSDVVRGWLATTPDRSPTVAGFLFGTLSAVAAGLLVNAIRWHLVDPLHYASGVPRRRWDYARLPKQVDAFRYLVANQFRYYECYANSMVAIAFWFAALIGTSEESTAAGMAAFLVVQLALWSASRRTLANYHERIAAFLGSGCDEMEQVDSPENEIDLRQSGWYIRRREVSPRRTLIPLIIRRRHSARRGT